MGGLKGMGSLKKIALFLILCLSLFANEEAANRVNSTEEKLK